MKKALFFTLLSILSLQYGCESHHNDVQQQEERQEKGTDVSPVPQSQPERGNMNR